MFDNYGELRDASARRRPQRLEERPNGIDVFSMKHEAMGEMGMG